MAKKKQKASQLADEDLVEDFIEDAFGGDIGRFLKAVVPILLGQADGAQGAMDEFDRPTKRDYYRSHKQGRDALQAAAKALLKASEFTY